MTPPPERMPLPEALAAVRAARGDDDVVITTMGTAREWMAMGSHPLDFVFVPGCMGHATSLGLGMALARPDRRVLVLNGDGSMLMNLGSLVSIAAEAPTNLAVMVFDNGVYEVTGAQPTPAGDRVDFPAVARACGIRAVFRCSRLNEWIEHLAGVLAAPGPTFIAVDVAPVPGARGPRSPGPAGPRAHLFAAALQGRAI
jgi:thiamine pyrophosphate-dependent acetolactate synthase large subunit-like protein